MPLLSAALKVFSDLGYRGACMRLIAQQAGISVGGVYLYFKNKEDLCLTMMKERMDDLSGELERVIDLDRPQDAMQFLHTLGYNSNMRNDTRS